MDEPTSGNAQHVAPLPPRIAPDLAAALARAQGEFGTIGKDRTAHVQGKRRDGSPVSYSYTFADLAAVLEAVRPALAKHELALVQLPNVRLDAASAFVGVETILAHSSGHSISTTLELPVESATPQAIGSGLTYARRYSVLALLGIAAEDEDDDAQGAQPKAPEPRPARERKTEPKAPSGPALASENQRRLIWAKAKAKAREHVAEGDTEGEAALAKEILRGAGVESTKTVSAREVDRVLAAIESYAPSLAPSD